MYDLWKEGSVERINSIASTLDNIECITNAIFLSGAVGYYIL